MQTPHDENEFWNVMGQTWVGEDSPAASNDTHKKAGRPKGLTKKKILDTEQRTKDCTNAITLEYERVYTEKFG